MSAELIQAFLAMQKQPVMDLIQSKLKGGKNPLDILMACQKGMEEVGKRLETGEFFLSELIYAAEVFKGVTALLGPKLSGMSGGLTSGGGVSLAIPRGIFTIWEKTSSSRSCRLRVSRSMTGESMCRPQNSSRPSRRPALPSCP